MNFTKNKIPKLKYIIWILSGVILPLIYHYIIEPLKIHKDDEYLNHECSFAIIEFIILFVISATIIEKINKLIEKYENEKSDLIENNSNNKK